MHNMKDAFAFNADIITPRLRFVNPLFTFFY